MTLVSCCCGLMPALDPGGWCCLPIGPLPAPTIRHALSLVGARLRGLHWLSGRGHRSLLELHFCSSHPGPQGGCGNEKISNLIISNQDLQVNLCRSVHRGPLKIADEASKTMYVCVFPLSNHQVLSYSPHQGIKLTLLVKSIKTKKDDIYYPHF